MSATESDPEDAITKQEIAGTAPAPEPSSAGVGRGTKRNAFAELMGPKPKKLQEPQPLASKRGAFTGSFKARDGLGAYTADPTSFPTSRVIYHNASFVAINDLYPKSTVHTLLLPRSPRSRLHPFDAFEDPEFLAAVQAETARLKRLVAKELQRRYGRFSAQDKLREDILNDKVEWEDGKPLPVGRDWEKELLVGIHAHPSMNDLHIHVLSRDRMSECMRHRKHYNSFNTPFLIDVADFPLAADDPRRHPGREGFLNRDLRCWRCGKNFENRFKKLKEHLDQEFEEWKKE
ncbi:HIT domain-containing protein [Xylaria bambusicola]|uniref:HIT domain-containing protein n=1 Tax=Xylaria bambusicola TaxID=326684 RepID=UPI0020078BC1|nr:HIT domain-containing protein [Xylaria bambusicola]KAI0514414.1 HIT domain-containing protein [Xylaria bambusicola]